MNSLLSNKYIWLLFIILGLQIPLSMIENQIEDRVKQREIARTSVRNSWTGEQDVLAALLIIPYQEKIPLKQQDQTEKMMLEDFQWVNRRLYITPENLVIKAELANQTLAKGIYEVPVYSAAIDLQADFNLSKYYQLIEANQKDQPAGIRFAEEVFISVGIKDIRGVVGIPKVELNDHLLTVMPGTSLSFYPNGYNAQLPKNHLSKSELKDEKLSIYSQLTVNGMERLSFLTMARENNISAKSDWPHPVFDGAFLPTNREISDEGYTANWKTGVFSTNINAILDSCFVGQCNELQSSLFGVKHIQSVDIYLQSFSS